jgi:hypothetical protein
VDLDYGIYLHGWMRRLHGTASSMVLGGAGLEVRVDAALQVVMASGWRDGAAPGCMCGVAHDYKCRRRQARRGRVARGCRIQGFGAKLEGRSG